MGGAMSMYNHYSHSLHQSGWEQLFSGDYRSHDDEREELCSAQVIA